MEEDEFLTINYDKIIDSKEFLAVTRMLAIDITKNPYRSIGDFLLNLSDHDLETLCDISENEDDVRFQEIVIITEMLASAEGLDNQYKSYEQMAEVAYERLKIFVAYLAIEGLARKGLVRIFRNNMSFGEDTGDKIVCEKI
jgi:hypothetical protein